MEVLPSEPQAAGRVNRQKQEQIELRCRKVVRRTSVLH